MRRRAVWWLRHRDGKVDLVRTAPNGKSLVVAFCDTEDDAHAFAATHGAKIEVEPTAEASSPVPASPSHTVTLPVSCTVAELRALLRQVPGSARLADVRILGAETLVSLSDLADVEMRFVGGAR